MRVAGAHFLRKARPSARPFARGSTWNSSAVAIVALSDEPPRPRAFRRRTPPRTDRTAAHHALCAAAENGYAGSDALAQARQEGLLIVSYRGVRHDCRQLIPALADPPAKLDAGLEGPRRV